MAAEPVKKSYHEQVAEKLIEQLQKGTAPWQKPWNPGEPSQMPMNPTTGNRYKGINAIQLMMQGRFDPRWMTYAQSDAAGAQVRKGEKGTICQKWIFTKEQFKKDDKGKLILDKEGKKIKETIRLERPIMRLFTVFNAEQIDGLEPLSIQPKINEQEWTSIERAEHILNNSGAVIEHNGQNSAFYRPGVDSIHLPDKSQFPTAAHYYATALHELGHWTGHASRLNRDLIHPFGSEGYAKEELRAEISSMILGDELGIGHDPSQHVAYVGSWIKVLRDDPLEIFRAASDAEKIQSYVLGFEQTQLQEQAQENELIEANLETETVTKQQEQVVREKIYLNVPYEKKDEAKGLGARWDRSAQSWYVPAGIDSIPFDAWRKEDVDTQTSIFLPTTTTKSQDRVYLAVPYSDRHEAKANGAAWDKAAKSWYIGPEAHTEKLQRWLPDNVPVQQSPAMSPQEEFAEVMRAAGFHVDGEHPIMDGRKQRIRIDGDKIGEESGFYVGHLDGHPAGYLKNYRTSVELKWKSKGYTLDPNQKTKLQAEAAEKRQARSAEQERLHEQTAQRIGKKMESLIGIAVEKATPYMKTKGILPQPGVFSDSEGKVTYIPAIDTNGKQWTMQYIQEDGTKRFAKNSRKEGCFHVIGGFQALSKAPVIIISEGYATASSVSQAVGFPTVAAFDAGNLPPVAKALRARFPDKPFIIAGDDDHHREATHGINPGKKKMEEAAEAVGGEKLLPIFAPGERKNNPKDFTDFNDLATKSVLGYESVVRQLGAVMKSAIAKSQKQKQKQLDHKEKSVNQLAI
ncbi:MAG: zincin-like metallopeptidase domain-containing protein [Gammaproteobacteria bacterium]